jgi:hypothetical protein
MINKNAENTLLEILAELRLIRQHLVPPEPLSPVELEQSLTRALGTGPDDAFNKQ